MTGTEKALDVLAERWAKAIMRELARENVIPACGACQHRYTNGNRHPVSGEVTDCCRYDVPPERCDSKSGCFSCMPKVVTIRTPACEYLKRYPSSRLVRVKRIRTKRATSREQLEYYNISIFLRPEGWCATIVPCYDCGKELTQLHASSWLDSKEDTFVPLCFKCIDKRAASTKFVPIVMPEEG